MEPECLQRPDQEAFTFFITFDENFSHRGLKRAASFHVLLQYQP